MWLMDPLAMLSTLMTCKIKWRLYFYRTMMAFLLPHSDNFQAAAAGADWANAEGYYMVLTNQPGASSWPVTGAGQRGS